MTLKRRIKNMLYIYTKENYSSIFFLKKKRKKEKVMNLSAVFEKNWGSMRDRKDVNTVVKSCIKFS